MAAAAAAGAGYGIFRLVRLLPAYQHWRQVVQGKRNARRLLSTLGRWERGNYCEVCGKIISLKNGDLYDIVREKWWCRSCAKKAYEKLED